MGTATLLRIAAAIAAVQGAAHATIFVTSKPRNGPAELAVVEAMKSNYFNFGGFRHSYWELYFGYGLLAALTVLMEAVIFWQLAHIAVTQPALVRPVVWLFIALNALHALITVRYFFLLPAFFDIIVIATLAAALFVNRQSSP